MLKNTIRLLICCFVFPAQAQEIDPFSSSSLTAPSPSRGPCELPEIKGALSLAEIVNRALCNNPQTKEAWANSRSQAEQVGISRSAYLPALTATGSLIRNSTASGIVGLQQRSGTTNYNQKNLGLSAGITLYDFGARQAQLESSIQLLNAANATQDAAIQSVFLASVQAYYQYLATHAAVAASVESERSAEESMKAAAAKYKAGSATPADSLQAKTAWSQAVLARIKAEGDYANAQGALANAMGLEADFSFSVASASSTLPDRAFEADLALLIAEAKKRRPDMASLEAQVKFAEAGVDIARTSGMPSFSLNSGYNYSGTNLSPSSKTGSLGISFSAPLFTGFSTTYKIRQAQAQVDVKMAQKEKLSRQISLDVWNAYHNLNTQLQSLKSSADLLSSATQSEKMALGRYKEGIGSIIDLLTAQNALAQARLQSIQAEYNWRIAKAALAQAMGKLDLAEKDNQ